MVETTKNSAFTLIEMLIVIVIIGILAAALVPRLQAVQARARDSQRKVDLRSLANANEIRRLDQGSYAQAGGCSYNNVGCYVYSTGTQPWINTLSGIMTSLPVDPINNAGLTYAVTGNYSYMYGNVYNNGDNYFDLYTQLENQQDPDRCQIKQYITGKPSGGGTSVCVAGVAPRQLLYIVAPY